MTQRVLIGVAILLFGALWAGCSTTDTTNANTNANADIASTVPGPDNSEITTTNESGVRTETRTFKNNPRVSRVVVTTRDGVRTVKVYSPSGEERTLTSETEQALNATADVLADAVGFAKTGTAEVGDKAEDVYDKSKDVTKTGVEKTKEGAEAVKDTTTNTARKVASKTEQGARTVVDKTKAGAKKATNTARKIIP